MWIQTLKKALIVYVLKEHHSEKNAYINVDCVVLARPLTCENCKRMDENFRTNDKVYGQILYCIQQTLRTNK